MKDSKELSKPLTTDEAARLLGLRTQTLHNWRHQRRGPRYCKVGRRVVYLLNDIQNYLERCSVEMEQF